MKLWSLMSYASRRSAECLMHGRCGSSRPAGPSCGLDRPVDAGVHDPLSAGDSLKNADVPGAATDVAAQIFGGLDRGGARMIGEKGLHGHDHAGRAVAALQRALLQE